MLTLRQHVVGIACRAAGENTFHSQPVPTLKIERLYTTVEKPGIAHLMGIYIGEGENELVAGVDCWEFSIVNLQAMQREFLEKHGLWGKKEVEIMRYLDKNELRLPEVPRLDLTTAKAGSIIRVVGIFKAETTVVFMGVTPG